MMKERLVELAADMGVELDASSRLERGILTYGRTRAEIEGREPERRRLGKALEDGLAVVSRSADTLEPYRDSRWLAPPAQLVGDAIAQTLSRQPWVSAVQQQTALASAPWALHCSLYRLEHDLRGGQGTVRLGLTCELANQRTRSIAAHWHFDGSQPLTVNDAAHFAQGAQTLLNQALGEIVQQARAAVAAAEASPPST